MSNQEEKPQRWSLTKVTPRSSRHATPCSCVNLLGVRSLMMIFSPSNDLSPQSSSQRSTQTRRNSSVGRSSSHRELTMNTEQEKEKEKEKEEEKRYEPNQLLILLLRH